MSVKSLQRNVIALASGVAALVALAGCTGSAAPAPSSAATTTPTTASAAGTPVAVPAVTSSPVSSASTAPPGTTKPAQPMFGPVGYLGLKLGMTEKQALATGLLTAVQGGHTCALYDLKGGGKVHISAKLGVAGISAPPRARTAEGIGVGSTLVAMGKAYPGIQLSPNAYFIDIAGEDNIRYAFTPDGAGKIADLTVELKNQDCYR